ncbi:MAG: ABC transporter substrate-binding protein [Eubacteriales bacterium]|nr:ABC transporter substrate-binding protein [Eubacteriales bacterium]
MKKNMSKFMAVLMAASLLTASIAGCSAKNETAGKNEETVTEAVASEEKASVSESGEAETKDAEAEEAETEAEKKAEATTGETLEITDMSGRKMDIPVEIDSVFSTGAVAAIYLYTLAPDKLLGWNYQLNDLEKSVILEEYHDLPNFGQNDAINFEAVIAAEPDIALMVGKLNDATKDKADKMSDSLGVPVVVVDSDFEKSADVYRFLGGLLGEEEQAEKLAAYTDKAFKDIEDMKLEEGEAVRVYYGNGEDSLETPPKGSEHGRIFDIVKAENVADLEVGDGSRIQISAEQLLAWNPDVIILNGEPKKDISGKSAAEKFKADPVFAELDAVKNDTVYGSPNAPFSWLDRPSGPNRIVGLRWLQSKLYPDKVNYNLDEEVKTFFELFYHVELSDEDLVKIYNGEMLTK